MVGLNQPTPPLERHRVDVQRQQLKRLENCAYRDECYLSMIWGYVDWWGLLVWLGFAALSGLCFLSACRALSKGECMRIGEGGPFDVYKEDDPFEFYFNVFLRVFFGLIFLVFVIGGGTQILPSNAKALHRAAGEGDIEAVKEHLAAGTDMNVRVGEWGDTPLHRAAFGVTKRSSNY